MEGWDPEAGFGEDEGRAPYSTHEEVQLPGCAYLSSPSAVMHGVGYPATYTVGCGDGSSSGNGSNDQKEEEEAGWSRRVIAVQCR